MTYDQLEEKYRNLNAKYTWLLEKQKELDERIDYQWKYIRATLYGLAGILNVKNDLEIMEFGTVHNWKWEFPGPDKSIKK